MTSKEYMDTKPSPIRWKSDGAKGMVPDAEGVWIGWDVYCNILYKYDLVLKALGDEAERQLKDEKGDAK